ncbi:MAG TPA: hypothetical protein VE693_04650 [Gaiellaceae bacterium]|nr:hypothetical protein [Gaiellaceae bacterium]
MNCERRPSSAPASRLYESDLLDHVTGARPRNYLHAGTVARDPEREVDLLGRPRHVHRGLSTPCRQDDPGGRSVGSGPYKGSLDEVASAGS